MRVEVLVATMNQNDYSLFEKMNIQSDVVFANQADKDSISSTVINGHQVRMITTPTKGVGLNRNIALLSSEADILIYADDDEVLSDGYVETVIEAFTRLPDADIIAFGLSYTKNGEVFKTKRENTKRRRLYNGLGYGAVRLAIKRDSYLRSNIMFSQLFGGGCVYCAGEDTVYLMNAFRQKLRIYSYPYVLCSTNKDSSSWFVGYDEKYFYDDGASIAAAFGRLYWLFAIYHAIKKDFKSNMNCLEKIKAIFAGIKGYEKTRSYNEWKNNNSNE